TTTIRMLCGLLTPDEGDGTCLGYDIRTETDKIKLHVGYMTQRFSLYQDLSVRENLEFVARIYGIPDARGAARAMIARLGLNGREEQIAGSLSGGWKQRLALGAGTLRAPQLLLLDEPTAGVDPKARREFWSEIHALAAEGLTVLVSTHYMDEAERCHEIAYIAYGQLLAHGTVDEVIAREHLVTYTVSGGVRKSHARPRAPFRRDGRAVRQQPPRLGPRQDETRGGDCPVSRRPAPHLGRVARHPGRRVHRPDGSGAGQFPMSVTADTAAARSRGGFLRPAGAMLFKEFLQLRRDRITVASMIMIPVMQLLLFG